MAGHGWDKGAFGARLGFTLLELLAALAIIGIMLSVGVTSYVGARRGAEMRGAIGTLTSTVSLARQHAVTKRRTTAIVFRTDGATVRTNSYYVFEKNGAASRNNADLIVTPSPASWPADGALVYNMTTDKIGRLYARTDSDGRPIPDRRRVVWVDDGSGGWGAGDDYAFQMSEKYFVPPGIISQVDGADAGQILFYANGRTDGMGMRTINLTDRMGASVTKTLEIYPLLGLVRIRPTP